MLNFIRNYFNFCKVDVFQKVMISFQFILLFVEIFSLLNGENMTEQFVLTLVGVLFYHIIMTLVLYKTGELK